MKPAWEQWLERKDTLGKLLFGTPHRDIGRMLKRAKQYWGHPLPFKRMLGIVLGVPTDSHPERCDLRRR
jgi:hypothetical protein